MSGPFRCAVTSVAPHAGAWIETGSIDSTPGGIESPLTQGRGLKLWPYPRRSTEWSPLTQGRGLKPWSDASYQWHLVAPHAGAWIETVGGHAQLTRGEVAPHAGAWIETTGHDARRALLRASPLTQGRGLKPVAAAQCAGAAVAPHAGAWIETSIVGGRLSLIGSPLTQGRGLKPSRIIVYM